MSFWQKIKASLAQFMQGRHGADNLSMFSMFAGLAFYILDLFLGTGVLSLLGLALYIWTIFRMFSKNNEKRTAENQKYIALTGNWKTKFRQFKTRIKNRKEYKYFKCPKCHALLRLSRGCGETTVTCGRCHHEFKEKA